MGEEAFGSGRAHVSNIEESQGNGVESLIRSKCTFVKTNEGEGGGEWEQSGARDNIANVNTESI